MTQRSCSRCDCLSAARTDVTICSHSSRWQTEKSIKRRKKVHSMFVIQTIRDNFARAIVHFVVSSLLQLQLIKINAADALRTVHTHNPKPNTASKHIHVQCSCSQWRARTKRDCNEFEWICELEILFKFWFSISAAEVWCPFPPFADHLHQIVAKHKHGSHCSQLSVSTIIAHMTELVAVCSRDLGFSIHINYTEIV